MNLYYNLLFSLLFIQISPFAISQIDSSISSVKIKSDSAISSTSLQTDSSTILKTRRSIVGYSSIAAYGSALYGLNKAWYANYPRSAFHFYNDNGEWNQVDKVGHAWSAYQLTSASFHAWKWTGVNEKKTLLYAGISGPGFLTIIEILDGFSQEWGFSMGDMAANILGSGLFLGQQAFWNEQKITFKFSFNKKDYNESLLKKRADNLFGKSWYERMLKDYNAQTYWLSGNIHSFFPESNFPKWLNISFGYGAEGMLGGYENKWTDKNGTVIDRTDIKRIRQFYLAPDIDLTKIRTRSRFLKTTFYLFNSLKFPAPTIMIDSKGKIHGYFLYF